MTQDMTPITQRLLRAVHEAQDVLAEYIVPDSGISDTDCVNRLLGILDHQDLVRAMVGSKEFAWKCNNCQLQFTHPQRERSGGKHDGGPACPRCKAGGQYTYRSSLVVPMTNPETSSDLLKRLEWCETITLGDLRGGSHSYAGSILGNYKVWGDGSWSDPHNFHVTYPNWRPELLTIDAAKAAAQAHFDATILSAIDAPTIERLTAERDELRARLFPYADDKQISGMSWNGFYLIGNDKSITELRRIENAAAQIEVYRAAFNERVAAAEARALTAESLNARHGEALKGLESACDAVAATRSSKTYLRMIDIDKAGDALAALDAARLHARALATESSNG